MVGLSKGLDARGTILRYFFEVVPQNLGISRLESSKFTPEFAH